MDDSASAFDSGSGRSAARRHTRTTSMAASFPASQIPFSGCNETFGRQRSHSSCDPMSLPVITLNGNKNGMGLLQPFDDDSGSPLDLIHSPGRVEEDSFNSIAVQPPTPHSTDTAPVDGLGLQGLIRSAARQSRQNLSPNASLMQNNANIMEWNTMLSPPFAEPYGMSSPVLSPVSSPILPSSSFDTSQGNSPYLSNSAMSSPIFPEHADFTGPVPGGATANNNTQSYVNSPSLSTASHRPYHLTVNTDLGNAASFASSSGSTPGWDFNRSPMSCASSSVGTSPVPSISDSGYPEVPVTNPYLNEAVIDESQFPGLGSQQQQQHRHQYQSDDSEHTTPTSFSQIPKLPPPQQNHLEIPASRQPRRDSDPFPRRNSLVQGEKVRIKRAVSQKGRQSPFHLADEENLVDLLQCTGQDASLPLPSQSSRSPTPSKGRRTGPMSAIGRAKATDRRVNKDTCVSCKVSRVQCDPSKDIWGSCTKCASMSSLPKTNGAHLCGCHSFSHKVASLTLDYTTTYWITPSRVTPLTPSRVFVPLPHSLSVSNLTSNFNYLLQRAFPSIRVSSNASILYDISLAGSIRYLSNERNSSLSSHRSFPALINTLSAGPEDGWLDLLTPACRLETPERIMSVMPAWTTQQGCFTYSLVSTNTGTVRQLDPDNALERSFIVSAAQVSRIIGRKVERIGLDKLQNVLPTANKNKPSPNSPPDPRHVRILGLTALSLRFQLHSWSLPTAHPPASIAIPASTHADCVEAIQWICRSLYVNHCWLRRIVAPVLSLEATQHIDCTISSYAGAGRAVSELMSRGESDDGFMEWWTEGAFKVLEAQMDPVVVEEGRGQVDVSMSGVGLYA